MAAELVITDDDKDYFEVSQNDEKPFHLLLHAYTACDTPGSSFVNISQADAKHLRDFLDRWLDTKKQLDELYQGRQPTA